MFRRILLTLPALLLLAACGTDTTGLTADLQSGPHPGSNSDAGVVVQVYSCLQCPACKTAHQFVEKPLVEVYGSRIRFDFVHMPLVSIHPMAMPAAEASECAADQGKFWEFLDLAYEWQDRLSPAVLDEIGAELSLDPDLYRRCRASNIKRAALRQSFNDARDAGVAGTPTYFVNGEQVPGTFEALSQAIEAQTTGMLERL
jgi:protein-disulfide isomerase